ncbi:MAG: hypothetical protein A3J07_04115 [Candidatus Doudnabacteria bacterium RIFCSPLOWO2_02_FULL_49_13]|uniref:DoxX family protein n=1 Tax=Candidatus Doudnabacteria bacterium RIFCSPHIGHO2_12_FULL_48_16 TaxID=1817838 RepID=A0A1F5PK78_9BACT|nr:MAG: hypothetical protein A3B77_02920 [Candidatus Doudnabacteria bacterium RIFCSPHIGHO2_02_FULL_49_24]OGE89237.1 MAG: hypothetical protein A2760_04500 [Candidatus Doudnabacteria bacterium RIFCSPHIGHO2_01_FULL_50_67]OGE90100.1 MAG: hypothetical protein A3E29_03255 [Candidatus Doudnabacteria bacterium RIFCSPHIGHO2_12_FULL_48_16]OGE97131.1 MAG: hypothetical protein A2990_00965 [Candidatus Doudnabacteria bacterium RIFCSPLOWO2_01_FULL_49_40]OGF03243.1 MAG: hypothetical protein A3J07_04115 [Candid
MSNTQKMEWALRIGVAGEFLGHGLLGLQGKADWIKWIMQLTHVSNPTAHTLLLIVGAADILVALIVLIKPINWVLLWAVFWGFWTALVRPLVGVGWLDFIERFANWGAPLALYYFYQINKK